MNNVNKHFLEPEETQKGHMHNKRQGFCSTKVLRHQQMQRINENTEMQSEGKKRDIFIKLYKLKDTMNTNQTRISPHRSIFSNKYQTILHKIEGNSTWIEPIKNNTEGEMILVRRRASEIMKDQGIVPKHQVLNTKIQEAYRM